MSLWTYPESDSELNDIAVTYLYGKYISKKTHNYKLILECFMWVSFTRKERKYFLIPINEFYSFLLKSSTLFCSTLPFSIIFSNLISLELVNLAANGPNWQQTLTANSGWLHHTVYSWDNFKIKGKKTSGWANGNHGSQLGWFLTKYS